LRVDQQYIKDVCAELVQIDSRNPALTPDGTGEEPIGQRVGSYLNDLGCQIAVHRLAPGRVNVVGVIPGEEEGPSLLWNGHLDTVGVEGMEEPFSGRSAGGRLYGRGSQDMKGSLAAMLGAAKALVDQEIKLKGELILAFVADEEDRSLGTEDLVQRYETDAAIVTEPTDLNLVLAHRGQAWYRVSTYGRAAHGSRFEEGVDAIMHMGRFLTNLDQLEHEVRTRSPHPLTGPPSLHTSTIQGGTDICTYPAHCQLELDRRTIPGEKESEIRSELEGFLRKLEAEDPDFQAEVELLLQRPVLETTADSPFCQVVQSSYERVLG
jgi:acetylornithine deacetylase